MIGIRARVLVSMTLPAAKCCSDVVHFMQSYRLGAHPKRTIPNIDFDPVLLENSSMNFFVLYTEPIWLLSLKKIRQSN